MNLEAKLKHLPIEPGVYRMLDAKGTIIYVGKALSLRARVRSYFRSPHAHSPKTKALVRNIANFEVITTDSEVEALILEQNMIKEHQPRYNVNLKDDKKYPYIRISSDPFPLVEVTRFKRRDGGTYYGPYTNVKDMRHTVDTLRRVFPTRTCKHVKPHSNTERACLNFHINRCPGVCIGNINEQEYAQTIKKIRRFLAGNPKEIESVLKEEMQLAATHMEYERAATIRDRLQELAAVSTRQKVLDTENIDRDIFAMARQDNQVCGLVLHMRSGKLIGNRHFYLTGDIMKDDAELTAHFLKQYYIDTNNIPREIYLQHHLDDETTVRAWLETIRKDRVTIVVPQKGERFRLLELATRNAKLHLHELLVQREKIKGKIPYNVEQLQKDLHLKKAPRLIEGMDISNTSGTDAVGSLVVFKDGRPLKKSYRHYKIKTIEGPDDFGMMREVVRRRYQRIKNEHGTFPDLIMVDGGKGQLSTVVEELAAIGLQHIPVIGLAKKLEEVFLPGIQDPQNIPKHSSGLKMLQALRDEAHRFAITYHKKLRSKRTFRSVLDDIPGIGVKTRTLLLKTLGSVDTIKSADIKTLSQVTGIGPAQAEKIHQWFHQENTSEKGTEK